MKPDTKPILFNTDMVHAILEGRKTVTRRVVKPQPKGPLVPTMPGGCWPGYFEELGTPRVQKPPYLPGDILYVRETFCRQHSEEYPFVYKASVETPAAWNWRPSIHMPREAARIFLRVTDVRVERLQEISDDDVLAEGTPNSGSARANRGYFSDNLWDSTIKPADRALYGWAANPWVWVIEFERCEKSEEANIDA